SAVTFETSNVREYLRFVFAISAILAHAESVVEITHCLRKIANLPLELSGVIKRCQKSTMPARSLEQRQRFLVVIRGFLFVPKLCVADSYSVESSTLSLQIVELLPDRQELKLDFELFLIVSEMPVVDPDVGQGQRLSILVALLMEYLHRLVVQIDRLLILPKGAVDPCNIV